MVIGWESWEIFTMNLRQKEKEDIHAFMVREILRKEEL
jgi:hypothetical protein